MSTLEEFTPIEQMFPQWLTARAIVSSCLPKSLRFGFGDQNALVINSDWAQHIFDMAPVEDRDAVLDRIEAAWGEACSVIDMQPFSAMLNAPAMLKATQMTLHRADEILAHQANEMIAARRPTPVEILEHMMGIAPAKDLIVRIAAEIGRAMP
ncbi:hypothetical protein [Pseudomonas extremaustralis]|uniref:hypothetical protein n=1 Tax=Pseudomonas extremaustralis TaxID=359110 RepID=UPI0028603807|nr:hypothetical protein [Pseudomonas extremaustralis]MDR6579993.1 hypothetical protein [Pseudomonas extremaustralis]